MSRSRNLTKRFIFTLATPEDGKELLDILEDAGFKGRIALLYTRRPDAYLSLKKEGEPVDIVVCRDREKGKIVGFGACALRKLFVNGKAENVGYLFGLRVRQEYLRKFPLLHRGYEFLHTLHKERGISLYMTTILEDNRYAQKLLEKRRPFMPTYVPYGSYEVYALKVPHSSPPLVGGVRGGGAKQPGISGKCQISLNVQRSWSPPANPPHQGGGIFKSTVLGRGQRWVRKRGRVQYCLRKAQQDDIPALVRFLTENGNNSQFFPVIIEKDLQGEIISGIKVEDFYLLNDEHNEILAAGALWDQTAYKQYLVQGYSGILRMLYPFSRFFPLFGLPVLPAPGSILNFFTLSFWAVKDNNPDIFKCFLDIIPVVAGEYPFFLIGIHTKHPLRDVLQKRPHISYKSHLYLVYWDEQSEYVDKLDKSMLPYLECGML